MVNKRPFSHDQWLALQPARAGEGWLEGLLTPLPISCSPHNFPGSRLYTSALLRVWGRGGAEEGLAPRVTQGFLVEAPLKPPGGRHYHGEAQRTLLPSDNRPTPPPTGHCQGPGAGAGKDLPTPTLKPRVRLDLCFDLHVILLCCLFRDPKWKYVLLALNNTLQALEQHTSSSAQHQWLRACPAKVQLPPDYCHY